MSIHRRTASAARALRLLLAAVVLLLAGRGDAAAQRSNFHHYTPEDGLPQRQIMAVYQGHTGYLWFGSYAGLTRFNGQAFTTYTTDDGLSSNIVSAIVGDARGRLWVGTIGGGVCLMEHSTFECMTAADGLADNDVNEVTVAVNGAVWVATDNGLSRIAGRSIMTLTAEHGLPHPMVHDVAATDDGVLWAATHAGLARFDRGRFVTLADPPLRDTRIRTLLPTPNGLLVGTDDALYERTDAGLRELIAPGGDTGRFNDAALDGDGNAWIATQRGIVVINGTHVQRYTERNGLLSDHVNRVAVDREGTPWFGTEVGVSKLVRGPFVFYTEAEGLPHSMVRALALDDADRLWIGTRAGVALLEGDRIRTIVPADSLPHPRVYALAGTRDGGMLIGTRAGLVHRGAGGTRTYLEADGLPGTFVLSLLPDPAGGVWIGTNAGVARWEDGRVRALPAEHPLSRLFVVSLAHDADGRLWVGQRAGGITVWDGRAPVVLGEHEGLTDQTVWSIDRDADGRMWVGSNGDGVFSVDGEEIRRLSDDDGLVNDFVWQVLAGPGGSVWMFTSRGLDRWDGTGFTHYSRGDGLAELEGSAGAALAADERNLWFGTSTGLIRYDAAEERMNRVPPPVVIERATSAAGEPLAAGAELDPGTDGLRIHYAALSFRDETAVRLRYRLNHGLREAAWSQPVPGGSIGYGGLGPGRYTFEVVGINEDGVRSAEPAMFTFTVLPAFWQTWWFWVISIGGLLIAASALPLLRARRLELDRSRLRDRVRDRTQELEQANTRLREEMREREKAERKLHQAQKMEAIGRLAGGVAHDFNNLLTSIVGHTDLALFELDETELVREELAEVRRSAERAAKLVEQLLAFSRKQMIKPELVELNEVVAEDAKMLRRLIGEDIELALELEGAGSVRIDRSQLDQVLINLALNARDAMPEGGRLTIATSNAQLDEPPSSPTETDFEPGPYLMLRVSDTGQGIEAAIQERIFEPFFTTKEVGKGTGLGLATVYGVVKQNNGWIIVSSREGLGSTFTIFLPRACAERPSRPKAGNETPAEPELPPGSGGTVLVVEDEDGVRDLVERVLDRHGYRVHSASNGEEALRFSSSYEGSIDLLLTDMIMPGENGQALAERVTTTRPDTRVLYISGYTDDVLGERGLLDDGIELLEKPFSPKTLVRRVRSVLAV